MSYWQCNVLIAFRPSSQGTHVMTTLSSYVSLLVRNAMCSRLPLYQIALPVAAPLQYEVCYFLAYSSYNQPTMHSQALSAVGAARG